MIIGSFALNNGNVDTEQLADTATTGVGTAAGLQEPNPVMASIAHGGPIGLTAIAAN